MKNTSSPHCRHRASAHAAAPCRRPHHCRGPGQIRRPPPPPPAPSLSSLSIPPRFPGSRHHFLAPELPRGCRGRRARVRRLRTSPHGLKATARSATSSSSSPRKQSVRGRLNRRRPPFPCRSGRAALSTISSPTDSPRRRRPIPLLQGELPLRLALLPHPCFPSSPPLTHRRRRPSQHRTHSRPACSPPTAWPAPWPGPLGSQPGHMGRPSGRGFSVSGPARWPACTPAWPACQGFCSPFFFYLN